MELSKLIKDFVLETKNAGLLVDLAKVSTVYIANCVLKRDSSEAIGELQNYLAKMEEFKEVNPDEFSVELVKYLYEQKTGNH